jgi:hypothetical protein
MRAVYSIVEIRDAMCGPDRKDNAGRMTARCKTGLKPLPAGLSASSGDANRAKIPEYIAGVKPGISSA